MSPLEFLLTAIQHPAAVVAKDTVVFVSKHPLVHDLLKPKAPAPDDVAQTANSFAVDDVEFKEV